MAFKGRTESQAKRLVNHWIKVRDLDKLNTYLKIDGQTQATLKEVKYWIKKVERQMVYGFVFKASSKTEAIKKLTKYFGLQFTYNDIKQY